MDDPIKRKRGRPTNASKWLTLDEVADIVRGDAGVIGRLLDKLPNTLPGAIKDADGWKVPERALRGLLGAATGPLPQMATVDEVAEALRRKPKTVYGWLTMKRRVPGSNEMVPMLPHRRVLGSILIDAQAVLALPATMPGPPSSFFFADGGRSFLMSEEITTELGFALAIVETEEGKGRWPDLTRLEAKRPDILAAIIWFLARGVSVKSITKALKVSPCTVNRVRHDPKWKDAVVSESKGVVEKLDEILALTVDDVLAQAREGKLPSIFDLKLLFDIRQLLSGGATQRTEVRVSAEEEEFMRFLSQASKPGLPGASGMVFEAEISPQLGDSAPIAPPSVRPNTIEAEAIRVGDCESLSKPS